MSFICEEKLITQRKGCNCLKNKANSLYKLKVKFAYFHGSHILAELFQHINSQVNKIFIQAYKIWHPNVPWARKQLWFRDIGKL